MKQIVPLSLTSCAFIFLGCGSNRPHFDQEALDRCDTRVVANATVPGRTPDLELKDEEISARICFSESGFYNQTKRLACKSNYDLAVLYNIRKPNIWIDMCYRADVEFYRDSSGYEHSSEPIIRMEPTSAAGLQIGLSTKFGAVYAGPQSEPGLVSENGDEASTGKAGIFLDLRYFPWEALGIQFQSGGLWGSATAPETESMEFTRQWTNQLGLELIPWQKVFLRGRLQLIAAGGLIHTRLGFEDEYKKFIESEAGIEFFDETATGFGWYGGGGIRWINTKRIVSDFGMEFSQEYPDWSQDQTGAFRGDQFLVHFGLGYQF
jgi:hypothetical protein